MVNTDQVPVQISDTDDINLQGELQAVLDVKGSQKWTPTKRL